MFRSNLIRRHPFTFIRDPIARFINGYATITMSQQQLKHKQRNEGIRNARNKTTTEEATVLVGLEDVPLSAESQLSGQGQRAHDDDVNILDLALKADDEVGSVAHVQAFIRYLLLFQGSSTSSKGKSFLRNPHHPLAPIFPQIGTLLRAAEVEKGGGLLRLYQYEHFEEEWVRMSNNSGYDKWM